MNEYTTNRRQMAKLAGWSLIPVSYTHLDVYKRQLQGFVVLQ